jgi:hypothetical protein
MNICVLRISGAEFAVDDFVSTSDLTSDRDAFTVWHKGEPLRDKSREDSGFILDICDVGSKGLKAQIEKVTAFLSNHYGEIKKLMETQGVESGVLDFAIAKRNVAAQFDRFPADLIRLAGGIGLEIELSQYAIAEDEE